MSIEKFLHELVHMKKCLKITNRPEKHRLEDRKLSTFSGWGISFKSLLHVQKFMQKLFCRQFLGWPENKEQQGFWRKKAQAIYKNKFIN